MCTLATTPPTTYARLRRCHTRSEIRHATTVGTLRHPFRSVYVGCEVPASPALDVRAAQLSIGRDLPAAFHSTAALQGFDVLGDGRTHLVGPERFDHRLQPGLWVHSTAVPPRTETIAGVLTVNAARAAIDLARTHTAADALATLDRCLHVGASTSEQLLAELVHHEGLRGVVQARELVDLADPRSESPQESRLRWIATAAGLPPFDLQIPVPTPDGDFRLDMGWREARVGVEYDGHGHADVGLLRYDRMRQNALSMLGWKVLTFTDWDIYLHPQRTAGRLASLIGRKARIVPTPVSTCRRPDTAAPTG